MTDHTAANALAVEHMWLVRQIAYKLKTTMPAHVDVEDLEGAGYLGLIQASRSFDPTRQVQFGAYARIRIRGAILDWLRKTDWISRKERARLRKQGTELPKTMVSLEEKLGDVSNADNVLTMRHLIASQHPGPEHDVDIADFWTAPLPELDGIEIRALQMYYRDGMTQKQIGAILGFSESRVSQILLDIRIRHAS